ncbi:unnamed protein product [Darwinula stevensoni]|uniref:Uncharacterized protein n=1 Tax=Darwinula stevensoni TaxID=69355 RepID=A0A7R9A8X7_9CRUS|nr:unnamed protein product [Darwinula stevensoni]CAG0896897.1 unnamed protein product [Darwinula stevensoni]
MLITLGLDSAFVIVENISSHIMGGTFIMNFLDYYAEAPRKIFMQAIVLVSVVYFYGIENFLSGEFHETEFLFSRMSKATCPSDDSASSGSLLLWTWAIHYD